MVCGWRRRRQWCIISAYCQLQCSCVSVPASASVASGIWAPCLSARDAVYRCLQLVLSITLHTHHLSHHHHADIIVIAVCGGGVLVLCASHLSTDYNEMPAWHGVAASKPSGAESSDDLTSSVKQHHGNHSPPPPTPPHTHTHTPPPLAPPSPPPPSPPCHVLCDGVRALCLHTKGQQTTVHGCQCYPC